jgi:DNA-binding GntR family transcriptional regulator
VKINPDDPEYPYVQLAGILRERIRAGKLTGRLPSVLALAEQSGLSAATVKRSLAVLRDEGLVVAMPGRGTFVKRDVT